MSANSGSLVKSSDLKLKSNSIFLTEENVLNLRLKKIAKYEEPLEIWSFRFGEKILAVSNLVSNTMIVHYYKEKFKLKGFKTLIGFIPNLVLSAVLPVTTTTSFMQLNYTHKLLKSSNQPDECMLCKEVETLAVHIGMGSVFPTFIAWFMNMYQAKVLNTYQVPDINDLFKSKKHAKMYLSQIKRIFVKTNKGAWSFFLPVYGLQLIFGSCLLYSQQNQFINKIEPLKFTQSEIYQVKIANE